MALDRYLARLTRIIVDSEGVSFAEAEALLRRLTLEVEVGDDAYSPAAHAAVLTAVSVGARTFVGGIKVTGATGQRLNTGLPIKVATLGEAAAAMGARAFDGPASYRIVIGTTSTSAGAIFTWWRGWSAGVTSAGGIDCDAGENPLAGVAAGALAVGAAFNATRGVADGSPLDVNLWPSAREAPSFADVFLPGAVALVGLGNLGQAFLWALSSLPYADAREVLLVLQDRDHVSEENWATSVLVRDETYGMLKTRVGETWALGKGFDVRRIDRRLLPGDRLDDDDPRLALCGVDKIEARKFLAHTGFDCVVDVGLGRTAANFDRYRVTVCDRAYPIDLHFEGQTDQAPDPATPRSAAYQELEVDIGSCGAAEVAGASVAAPYVSAIAAAVSVARLIAIVSGCTCPRNEVRKLSEGTPRTGSLVKVDGRGVRHAGRPLLVSDGTNAGHPVRISAS